MSAPRRAGGEAAASPTGNRSFRDGVRGRGTLLAGLALLAACAGRAPEPPPVEPARDALAVLARQEEGTQTLRALFAFEARTADGRDESGRGALVVARPDRMRLQLFSFGFVTVYDYVADGERWRARFPLEGKTESGRFDDPAANGAAGRWDLRPLFFREGGRVESVEEEGRLRRVRFANGREVVVSLDEAAVVRETIPTPGGEPVRVHYARSRPVDGVVLPFRIEVEYPGRAATLAIEVESYERNAPVDENVFRR